MLRSKAVLKVSFVLGCLMLSAPLLNAEEIFYDFGNRRDPFVALTAGDTGASSAYSSGLKLEGIIYDPGSKSMAILSGKTYQVGETVGEATVVRILKDKVVVSVAGEEKTLWIRAEETSS